MCIRDSGYTVLYDAAAFSINPVLRKLPYDAKKDFICLLYTSRCV